MDVDAGLAVDSKVERIEKKYRYQMMNKFNSGSTSFLKKGSVLVKSIKFWSNNHKYTVLLKDVDM